MSLLHARALSVRYGPKVLLDGASFALGHHDRAGLIGPNGSGKSTLLKILAGQLEPDGGAVQLVRKARAGYLPQELSELPPGSVLDGVLASVPGRSWLQARLAAAEAALAQAVTEEEQVELGGELAELHEQLAHHEELYGRHRAEEILGGLGFARPELLLRAYAGNYERCLELRAAEEERLAAQAEKQSRRRAQMQAFIDRFRAKATKARQVQSRVRLLEKEEIVQVREERATVRFRFPEAPRSGREVARLERVSKSYGATSVFRDLSAQVLRGDRTAVIGLNGAGKTTLLKLLAGEIEPDAGTVVPGHNLVTGYFAQHHTERLDAERTILEEVHGLVPTQPQSWVRGVLGSFLFSGDEVDKRIGVLSGGERARVALARLLVVPSNFLLMDEPTNHLDLDSSEALIDALTRYEGTLLFVSHNRSFVNGLATRIWEVRDGGIDAQPGDLDDWSRRRAEQTASEVQAGSSRPAPQGVQARRERALQREQRDKVLGPIKRAVAELEQRIAQLEQEKKAAEAQLADPALFSDPARSTPLISAYRDASRKLEELYARWEHKSEELAAAESRLP